MNAGVIPPVFRRVYVRISLTSQKVRSFQSPNNSLWRWNCSSFSWKIFSFSARWTAKRWRAKFKKPIRTGMHHRLDAAIFVMSSTRTDTYTRRIWGELDTFSSGSDDLKIIIIINFLTLKLANYYYYLFFVFTFRCSLELWMKRKRTNGWPVSDDNIDHAGERFNFPSRPALCASLLSCLNGEKKKEKKKKRKAEILFLFVCCVRCCGLPPVRVCVVSVPVCK